MKKEKSFIINGKEYTESQISKAISICEEAEENIIEPKVKNVKTIKKSDLDGDVINLGDGFLKITNVQALDHDLIIRKKLNIFDYTDSWNTPYKVAWDKREKRGKGAELRSLNVDNVKSTLENALKDYDGWNNTKKLLERNKGRNYEILNVLFANEKMKVTDDYEFIERLQSRFAKSDKYEPYIPALGELNVILYNLHKIYDALGVTKDDNEDNITQFLSSWSSTAYNETCMWGSKITLSTNYNTEDRKSLIGIVDPYNPNRKDLVICSYTADKSKDDKFSYILCYKAASGEGW